MRSMLDGIYERAGVIRNQKMEQKKQLTDRIASTEQHLMSVTREMKLKIHNMVEEVEQKVSKALNEEIWRLGVLVDEFNLPFHTEPLVMNVYKKEINAHVETGLGSNLRSRLSTALAMNVETAQREMTGTLAVAFFNVCGFVVFVSAAKLTVSVFGCANRSQISSIVSGKRNPYFPIQVCVLVPLGRVCPFGFWFFVLRVV